jgi:hypothetical protein
MKITRFEDLECWQESVSLAVEIYRVSKEGDFGKDLGFRDQLRRAAVSVASNIVPFALGLYLSRMSCLSRFQQDKGKGE